MRYLLLAAFVLSSWPALGQAEDIDVPPSYPDGVEEVVKERWPEGSDSPSSRTEYHIFYNEEGNVSRVEVGYWKGNEWKPLENHTYAYDGKGRLTKYSDGEFTRSTFTYTSFDSVRARTVERFYDSEWVNWHKEVYGYDDQYRVIRDTTWMWKGGRWVGRRHSWYEYAAKDSVVQFFEDLEGVTNTWDGTRTIYIYGNNGILEERDERYEYRDGISKWWASSKNIYHYGDGGRLSAIKVHSYNGDDGWVHWTRFLFTYDIQGRLSEDVRQYWSRENKEWENDKRMTYRYEGTFDDRETNTPGAPNLPQSITLKPNYPNPFNPSTIIPYALDRPTRVTIVVYDMMGRRVRTLVDRTASAGHHKVRFSARGLSSGLYFYRLKADGRQLQEAMMLVE